MFVTLMLIVTFWSTDPFPVAPDGDRDLQRMYEAWRSDLTSPVQRGEMDTRLRAAAQLPDPDWRAVADSYFAWRNRDAAAIDLRNATTAYVVKRAALAEEERPQVCTTETISRPRLFGGGVESTSKTTCDK